MATLMQVVCPDDGTIIEMRFCLLTGKDQIISLTKCPTCAETVIANLTLDSATFKDASKRIPKVSMKVLR